MALAGPSKVDPVFPTDSPGRGAGLNQQNGPAAETADDAAWPEDTRPAGDARAEGTEAAERTELATETGPAKESGPATQTGPAKESGPASDTGRGRIKRLGLPRRARPQGTAVPAGAAARPATDSAPAWASSEVAGALLARLTVLPAILILAWLIPALPLLLAGAFAPVPALLISVPLAAALAVNGLRVVPASWPRLLSGGRTAEPDWTTWFGLLATVAVVAALTAWQLAEGSEALIVLRAPGTYLQAAYWIAEHGSLPIPEMARAFGGAHPGLSFASTGFLARGGSLYPGVTPGLPLLLAGSLWAHGVGGATATGPLLGGLAALTFAGLVARLVGPQWAPAGALVLGLSLPQQYIGRTTLSETALQIVLFGGLCLLVDSLTLRGDGGLLRDAAAAALRRVVSSGAPETAVPAAPASAAEPVTRVGEPVTPAAEPVTRAGDTLAPAGSDETAVLPAPPVPLAPGVLARRWAAIRRALAPSRWAPKLTPQRLLAALAGASLGFGLLISLDGLVYLPLVIPFCCALFVGRRPQAAAFPLGCLVGIGYGLLGCYLLDRPFLDSVGHTVALSGVVAIWLIALSVVVMQLPRFGWVRSQVPARLAKRPLRWLPEAGAWITLAALVGFAIRPYVQTVHGHPSLIEYDFIERLQKAQGLPVDPSRLYSEQTLYWVIWYIGLPTVLLGGVGAALLVRRCLRALLTWRDPTGVWRVWGLPLAIFCAASAISLWDPDIDPDQPWASRRLIVTVIPGLIICALWASSWLARRARDRGAQPGTAAVASLFCVAAMLVPIVATTFGLGLSHTGRSGGLTPVAQGLATTRTGGDEIDAVADLCSQLPGNASVVIVGEPTAAEFTEAVRGMCGVPVATMSGRSAAEVDSVISSITAVGRRPLLLAASRAQLAAFGGTPVRVLDLYTTQDPHQLTQLPTSPNRVRYQVWLTSPGTAGVGA